MTYKIDSVIIDAAYAAMGNLDSSLVGCQCEQCRSRLMRKACMEMHPNEAISRGLARMDERNRFDALVRNGFYRPELTRGDGKSGEVLRLESELEATQQILAAAIGNARQLSGLLAQRDAALDKANLALSAANIELAVLREALRSQRPAPSVVVPVPSGIKAPLPPMARKGGDGVWRGGMDT
jgi:hypothetical protein